MKFIDTMVVANAELSMRIAYAKFIIGRSVYYPCVRTVECCDTVSNLKA